MFVIHGRNDTARNGVFTFLRAIGLKPIEWEVALEMTGHPSPYIGEVLDVVFARAQALIVLMTPDDIVHLDPTLCAPDDPELAAQGQPRPNVLIEAGMALARHSDRTVIVEFGKVKIPSDIDGRHRVRLDDSVTSRQRLANRLNTAGCAIDITGLDWHTDGDLTPPVAAGGLPLGKKMPKSDLPTQPRLKARYVARGRNSFGQIHVTNHGPGDIFGLNLDEEPDARGDKFLRDTGNLPLNRLPEGETVALAEYLGNIFAGSNRTHATLVATGQTEDGHPVRQELFVSLAA
ncbi:nucleotide-binding protein [Mycolicibacterium fortuitum]|nr:nucleotide-binding protein [Mycolicibacterium fortuitum]